VRGDLPLTPSSRLADLAYRVDLADRRSGVHVRRTRHVDAVGNHAACCVDDVDRLRILLCRVGKSYGVGVGRRYRRSINRNILSAGGVKCNCALLVVAQVKRLNGVVGVRIRARLGKVPRKSRALAVGRRPDVLGGVC